MKTSHDKPPKGRTKLAHHFRKNMSEAEWILWSNLKNRGMGVKFRRQVPIGRYIVDFLSMEIKLVIEADGSQHGNKSKNNYDNIRDNFLK